MLIPIFTETLTDSFLAFVLGKTARIDAEEYVLVAGMHVNPNCICSKTNKQQPVYHKLTMNICTYTSEIIL